MSRIFDTIDRYKYGIIAAFAMYIGIFVYLQMETYTHYYPINPYFEEPSIILPEEMVEVKPENIDVPEDYIAGDVKNIARDMNDQRQKSDKNWDQNMSSSDVEKQVRDYEKQLHENTGEGAKQKKILQDMADRKNEKITAMNNPKETTNQSGGNTAYAGNVMVTFKVGSRTAHQNNKWYVRNPGYTCGYGSAGTVTVLIEVNQNGDVVSANATGSSGVNACMLEQAEKYAKMSRFNYGSGSTKIEQGYIKYIFIGQ